MFDDLTDAQFLRWVRNRFLFVYRFSRGDALVLRLDEIADRLEEEK